MSFLPSSSKQQQQQQPPCQVRVGVRLRPLTSQEVGQGGKSVLRAVPPEVRLGERRFTYDAVFDERVDQNELYSQVSRPLLGSFLEGFNATIMAYGQTGSGKTFTMGSEAHTELELSDNTGLIPRFMNDLFFNLEKQRKASQSSSQFTLQASFLEVYGEDVHDLLDPSRTSLPLREDASGGVVCAGLTHRSVSTAMQALTVLHEGTMNRTTAATLMNLTSSRSHAIFTVYLSQTQDGVVTKSRFTFVDLAGSERMKKTGAEGERAREGIKINEGLLALGNVINALADDERAASGKTVHVPYRQSKLTRLLQDALGGNSQTLFLACVSPSDTNANETLSTLHYANRARNIKNAPTRNVDGNALELQRLQSLTSVLQAELIKHKFASKINEEYKIGEFDASLLQQQDVSEYLDLLQVAAQEKQGAQDPFHQRQSSVTLSNPKSLASSSSETKVEISPLWEGPLNESIRYNDGGDMNKSIIDNFHPLGDVNPDEDMAILDQLLELQQRDSDFQMEQKEEDAELKQVEGEIVHQQNLLLQLKESLKVYHDMKEKYECLMAEVRHLEVEKVELAEQLEKASADPTKGCSKAIKKELEKVEQALARARNEGRKHREKYRKAEQEAKKSAVLQRKITELKAGRVRLIKKQEETTIRHREYTEARTKEILALKRKDRSNEQRVTKMQKEIQLHKKNLDKRQDYCKKLKDKLDQTEAHLMKLLSMRNQELRQRTSTVATSRRRSSVFASKSSFPLATNKTAFAPSSETTASIGFLLDQAVSEKLRTLETDKRYEECVIEYSQAMRSMVEAVNALRKSRSNAMDTDVEEKAETERDLEQTVEEIELKVELLGDELENLRRELAESDGAEGLETMTEKVIKDKDAPILRTVLLDTLEKLVDIKMLHTRLERALLRKESALNGLEDEVERLQDRVEALTKDNNMRRALGTSGQEDAVDIIRRLESENKAITTRVEEQQKELSNYSRTVSDISKDKEHLAAACREAQEKAALAFAAASHSDKLAASQTILDQIHGIWKELGPTDRRSQVQVEIENSLDNTCTRLYEEALQLKSETLAELETLEKEIQHMHSCLGIMHQNEPRDNIPLLEQLKSLRLLRSSLEPTYQSALARYNSVKHQASTLVVLLGLPSYMIPGDLRSILGSETDSATDLRDECLSRCEEDVSNLRVQKSQLLVSNAEVLKEAFDLVTDMNLPEDQLFPLVVNSMKRRHGNLPEWWDLEQAEMVIRAAATPGGVVRATHAFREHLLLVHASLESLAKSRRVLSDKLKDLVEKAQETLLETVDGEVDAIEAYASFHDALFRLPPLSKERMKACTVEVDALLTCVDDMIQSEIEALVVVHDALSVGSSDRGKFWGEVEEATTQVETNVNGPFDEVVHSCSVDGEEWILQLVKDATKNYRQLESRLIKLQMIHKEVERLRSRQDTKSKIISLDSEVRILSTRISEFENKKCSKQRLLTKKSGGVNLLKEERFRKQMQQKFSSKLEKLSSLLQSWREDNEQDFDSHLLSDEVRMLIESGGNMDEWVEKRTEFMHLRTTQSMKPPPRIETIHENEATLPPSKPPRRVESVKPPVTTESRRKTVVTKATASSTAPSRKRKIEEQPPVPRHPAPRPPTGKPNRAARSTIAESTPSRTALSPSQRRRTDFRDPADEIKPSASKKKRLTLPPFGHVLEQASTPRRGNKEN